MASHRKAYGAHRLVSAQQKAADVAMSILARTAEGRKWSWGEYGLEGNASQQQRVMRALDESIAIPARFPS